MKVELTNPYVINQMTYIFTVEGLFKITNEGTHYRPSEKVVIVFENDSLVNVEYENLQESDVDYELWWELQRLIADKIKELKDELQGIS